MKLLRILFAAMLLGFGGTSAVADGVDDYPLLRESFDPGLQNGLEGVISHLGMQKAVRDHKLNLVLVDISDIDEPRVASINGDEMLYAASLPKIAILLGAFVEIERGNMVLDAATRDSLVKMIRHSSNSEATRMLNRVGKDNLIEILRSERFRLYDPVVNGGLWVGKEYGRSSAYRRDPLHNLSHGATAMQVARFYYLLETGQLVRPDLTKDMKAILGDPAINHKFVKGLKGSGARIFRKSGSWKRWHADSAIVEVGNKKYIAVALAENASGGLWLSRLIRSMHPLVVPTKVAASIHQ